MLIAATWVGAAGLAAWRPGHRRAIVVSFDALNEARLRESIPAEYVPVFRTLFDSGACAEYAVSAFPSLSAPSHAALWTGAYGDVSGSVSNQQPRLPRDRYTLLELGSGFSTEALRAEPLAVAAARAGRTVVGHSVQYVDRGPGYPPVQGEDDPRLTARREENGRVMAAPGVRGVSGFRSASPHRVLSERTNPPRPAAPWRNLERLGEVGVPLREIGWLAGRDSVFAVFYGRSSYTHVLVARERDAAHGVTAAAAPAERRGTHGPRGRLLARHFSGALEIPVEAGRAFLAVRLFELAPDGSSFRLYSPALNVIRGNRPEVAAAYDAAVRGWVSSVPLTAFLAGEFGRLSWEGGDGTAEARLLEAMEYSIRQSMRGTEWLWTTFRPDLLLDYVSLGDVVDHALYGYVDPAWPGYRPDVAARVQELRRRAWELVDLHLALLRSLAASGPNVALFVSGDHGMRATWRVFRPNAALREAGLLALDRSGAIDLPRTRALSPEGHWISVNRIGRRGGIVPPAEEPAVLAAAEAALRGVRDGDGAAAVTRIFRPAEHPRLGIGGPVGGDLYFGLAPGIQPAWDPKGPALAPDEIGATHGFPPDEPDMWTVTCAMGAPFRARRIAPVRNAVLAPTVAEWLGFPPPADAVERSVLKALLGR